MPTTQLSRLHPHLNDSVDIQVQGACKAWEELGDQKACEICGRGQISVGFNGCVDLQQQLCTRGDSESGPTGDAASAVQPSRTRTKRRRRLTSASISATRPGVGTAAVSIPRQLKKASSRWRTEAPPGTRTAMRSSPWRCEFLCTELQTRGRW